MLSILRLPPFPVFSLIAVSVSVSVSVLHPLFFFPTLTPPVPLPVPFSLSVPVFVASVPVLLGPCSGLLSLSISVSVPVGLLGPLLVPVPLPRLAVLLRLLLLSVLCACASLLDLRAPFVLRKSTRTWPSLLLSDFSYTGSLGQRCASTAHLSVCSGLFLLRTLVVGLLCFRRPLGPPSRVPLLPS